MLTKSVSIASSHWLRCICRVPRHNSKNWNNFYQHELNDGPSLHSNSDDNSSHTDEIQAGPDFPLITPDWEENQQLGFMFLPNWDTRRGQRSGVSECVTLLLPLSHRLQRPTRLKKQLWPIYGFLRFFPSRPRCSFPSHLSFPLQVQPSNPT